MGIFRFRLTEECCKVVLFRVFSMILAGSFFGLYSICLDYLFPPWQIVFRLDFSLFSMDRTFAFLES